MVFKVSVMSLEEQQLHVKTVVEIEGNSVRVRLCVARGQVGL